DRRDRDYPDHWDGGPERPREQRPGGHPRDPVAPRRRPRERARDCRPGVPLGKEIRDGRGSHASERHGDRDLEGEKPRGRHVQEVEQYDAARPQTGLHPQQPESEPERQLALAVGWRSLLEEPSRRGIRLLEAQCHTRGNDNADVGNRGDQVPQHQLCRGGGPALELRGTGNTNTSSTRTTPVPMRWAATAIATVRR